MGHNCTRKHIIGRFINHFRNKRIKQLPITFKSGFIEIKGILTESGRKVQKLRITTQTTKRRNREEYIIEFQKSERRTREIILIQFIEKRSKR